MTIARRFNAGYAVEKLKSRRDDWDFSRPYGTLISYGMRPGIEMPGYYQRFLWNRVTEGRKLFVTAARLPINPANRNRRA